MTTTDHDPTQETQTTSDPSVRWALPLVTVTALLVDAVVHLHLAPGYQLSAPGGIGAGNLFRVEAVIAVAVAAWVLLRGTRNAYAAAFLIAASGLGAVLLYRYVNVPMIGPLPAMYEPVWFPEKTFSAVAEAAAAVVAGIAVLGRARVRPRADGTRGLSQDRPIER